MPLSLLFVLENHYQEACLKTQMEKDFRCNAVCTDVGISVEYVQGNAVPTRADKVDC